MRLLVASLTLLMVLAAGCGGPSGAPDPTPPSPVQQEAKKYEATVVVTQETPSGKPLQATVMAVPLREDGTLGAMETRGTDTQGAVRFTFSEPTTLLVRAHAPKGWTTEGARIHIDDNVAAAGLTVSDRDVFLPLYRDSLAFAVQHSWSTVVADQGMAAMTVAPLDFPEGLQQAYLSRLSDAKVAVTWTDSPQGRAATIAAGLAWDGAAWVEGEQTSAVGAGQRTATWDGDLPAERPADLDTVHLQAAILTRSAVVGDVLFGVETTLTFGGKVPSEMPADPCALLLC